MKDEHLINYSLFCKRKRFSLYSFMLKNKEVSYEDVVEYFRNKSVTPPSKDLFEKTRQKALIDLKLHEEPQQELTKEKSKTSENKDNSVNKSKRKSRRRKNEQS